MSIYEKIALVQENLFVPKQNDNTYGHYKYRSCEDILMKVKPLCKQHKMLLIMNSRMCDMAGQVAVEAMVDVIDLESDSSVTYSAWALVGANGGMDKAQASGSALSYARKYALAGLFAIDNEKDNDNNAVYEQTRTPEELKRIQEEAAKKAAKTNTAAATYTAAPGATAQKPAPQPQNPAPQPQVVNTPVPGAVAQGLNKEQMIAGMKACTYKAALQNLYYSQPQWHNDAEVNAVASDLYKKLQQQDDRTDEQTMY